MLFTSALTWALQLFPSSEVAEQHPHHGHHGHHDHGHGRLIDRHLEEKIHQLRKDWDVPGLTVAIVASPNYTRSGNDDGHKQGWRETFVSSGIRAVDGDKVTPDTMWSIASNSKFFVALSTGLLIHDGVTLESGEKLSWNTKVKDVLWWTLMDKYVEEHLTLGDMLSMQSGLPRHDQAADRSEPAEVMLEQMAHFKPSTGIRQHWQYNNYHYQIMPLIFPKYAGMSFPDFVQKRIWDPLDIKATYNFTAAIESGRLSQSFLRRNHKLERCKSFQPKGHAYPAECFGEVGSGGYWNEGHDDLNMAGAGGAVLSSRDEAKWLREVLDPKVIPAQVLHDVLGGRGVETQYPKYPEIGLGTYCLAHETYSYRGHQVYQHSGGLAGQLSFFSRIPDRGIGVFTEANDDAMGSYIGKAILYMVYDHMLGLPPIDWAARYIPDAVKNTAEGLSDETAPSKPRDAQDIVGKYHDAGYGLLDIKPVEESERYLLRGKSQGYAAKVNKFFVSHFVFTHVDGPIWQWRTVRVYPEHGKHGHIKDSFFTNGGEHGTCVFKEDGVGFFGDLWGQGAGIGTVTKPDEENTEENAEVWFKKQ